MAERWERLSTLLELVLALQANAEGLTVEQIAGRFGVARRTAERMIGAATRALPELESYAGDDGRKHWRLPRRSRPSALIGVLPEEIAALETMADLASRDGRADHAESLRSLARKVRALLPTASATRIETDAEALLEGEGIAMRPGPRPKIDVELVAVLRQAILACREVRIRYRSRIRGEERARTVRPYGFLLGGRHYLVAHDVPTASVRMFSLANVLRAEITADPFEIPAGFSLREWAEQSFGVFHDKPHGVVLRFRPESAALAREYRFHPTQTVEEQADGSLVVRFRAGGLWEMAWHLFQWRDGVEVVEPEALRHELVAMLEDALRAHRKG